LKYRFDEFEIDLIQQELRRGDKFIHIEPQVFDLIVHLVRNHDRIISKDELIENIWHGRIISEAALSSRINAARRALGDNGNDQSLIRTLHKRGFRFVGPVHVIDSSAIDGEVRQPVREENIQPRSKFVSVSVATEVSNLNDVVSEAVRAEAVTQLSIAVMPFGNMSDDPENDYFISPSISRFIFC
jgi:DNA-binding winged helix-turn-helix (wHTH) protein